MFLLISLDQQWFFSFGSKTTDAFIMQLPAYPMQMKLLFLCAKHYVNLALLLNCQNIYLNMV